MKFKFFNSDGSSNGDKVVDNFPNLDEVIRVLMHLRQSIIAVHANQRQGNASTKVRSEVRGSGKKIYRQKGLGVGTSWRQKSNPTSRGGGVVFGPRPRSYRPEAQQET